MAGITKNTPDPFGGTYEKDAKGELSGRTTDRANRANIRVLPRIGRRARGEPDPERHLEEPLRELCEAVVPEGTFSDLETPLFVNTVDLVLSQEPLQGKAIFDLYDVDVQSPGFPTAYERILDYVEQRYLARVRAQNVRNFGTVLCS